MPIGGLGATPCVMKEVGVVVHVQPEPETIFSPEELRQT